MDEDKEKILQYLYSYKRKTIPLDALEGLCSGKLEYVEFVELVQQLVSTGVLSEAVAKVREYRGLSLCMKYKINVNALYKATVTDIQAEIMQEKFHVLMDFSYYFKHPYISSSTFSWEESNKWSGGEKWSKNMALFLGCLNYLSEKRKHIRKTAYCNRVVIADNPFGKASSEHVLDPIFFIAKQLGFQVIALTAHDEGSFIRKYFPVVYSCRFSSSHDQKTKIIQTDKEVQTAFFQEKNPDFLSRLTDYQEIGMF